MSKTVFMSLPTPWKASQQTTRQGVSNLGKSHRFTETFCGYKSASTRNLQHNQGRCSTTYLALHQWKYRMLTTSHHYSAVFGRYGRSRGIRNNFYEVAYGARRGTTYRGVVYLFCSPWCCVVLFFLRSETKLVVTRVKD
jgi:hypothetical protein